MVTLKGVGVGVGSCLLYTKTLKVVPLKGVCVGGFMLIVHKDT